MKRVKLYFNKNVTENIINVLMMREGEIYLSSVQ